MLIALLLSTRILWTRLLAILAIITRASLWGWHTQFASALTMSSDFGVMPPEGYTLVSALRSEVGTLLLRRTCCEHDEFFRPCKVCQVWYRPPFLRVNLQSFSLVVFCLYGPTLLAIRLSPTSGLAITLSLAVRCKTDRLKSIRCALVTYRLLFVCQLATTLGVSVHCNTAIRLESVHYALVAFWQTSVHCVLIVSGLLPICSAFLKPYGWEQLGSALEPKFVYWVPVAISLIPVRYVFCPFPPVPVCSFGVQVITKHRIPTVIGLIPVCCIPMAIE